MKTLELLSQAKWEPTEIREPYLAYSYAYPHKSAYGPLCPPALLQPHWQAEARDALFLYVHIPFCEMRCGFCNLFTRAQAGPDLIDSYLATLSRQARIMADILGDFTVARFALGGGTPTFLAPRQLELVFDRAERDFSVDARKIPTSVETSPKTATADRLAILLGRGVQRVSIGVQSFDPAEAHAIGRPQSSSEVHAALERLQAFPILNIDLIYGQPGQSMAGWLGSVRTALRYEPEEIFLYPLYIRPHTGLDRQGRCQPADAARTRLFYRAARDVLLEAGYEQISMRCFRALHSAPLFENGSGPNYCCQTDAMVGLGCGARSYTAGLHYSSPFAVEAADVQAIIDEWIALPDDAFRYASWGVCMTDEERQRRFVIQSLLNRQGLDEAAFEQSFGPLPQHIASQLTTWEAAHLVEQVAGRWHLTAAGLELSDHLGPTLYSDATRSALEAFVRR